MVQTRQLQAMLDEPGRPALIALLSEK